MEEKTEPAFRYFDLQATMGTTKHMGGLAATLELIEASQLKEGQDVLEVGCGVGATACLLVKRFGCRVVGVDRSEAMLQQARERAQRERVEEQVRFLQAEAGRLPFEGERFDLALSESVTTFVVGRDQAVAEYARVVKAGGRVALNEETWLQAQAPEGLVEFTRRTWEIEEAIPTAQDWAALLERNGLEALLAQPRRMNWIVEASQVKRYRWADMRRMIWRVLALYARNPAFRRYMKERSKPPKELFTYLGYGLYLGRKR
ncbi:MAG: class I SAM-dependent methyltransferase [Anaerolineales bacterium]|nr:class I SAM-dependent methyltransferase [Anaerolineales bacterium]